MEEQEPHVEVRGLSKSYGGVRAVRDATLSIRRGEVHALVGENGAGKSTLGKMIAGVVRPSSGEILVEGTVVEQHTPRHMLGRGIAIIEQELAMVPERSVLDNVFLGNESGRRGVFRGADQRRRYDALIERTGFDLDPQALAGHLRIADQQKVEILRALSRDARLIVMDEPTAPLTQSESEQLYEIVRNLQAQGTTIIFISHFLEEVLLLADVVTIMRDGAIVRTRPAAEETPHTLVEGMLGRSMELTFPTRLPTGDSAPVLEVRNLSAAGRFQDVSFDLHPGEILGLAGLVGSGRTEIARAIFGADPVDEGEVILDGRPLRLGSPGEAIRRGLVMLPESRKDQGLVMTRSVAENLTLAQLPTISTGGVVRRRAERAQVVDLIERLGVRCDGHDAAIDTLSGGNQQKVLFGKWLMSRPRVFIVDEPTRGVDVGAKRAIYDLICSLAAEGMAVLLISSELEEVLGLAHRVLVMRNGRAVASLAADDANEESVLAAAFGTELIA